MADLREGGSAVRGRAEWEGRGGGGESGEQERITGVPGYGG